MRTLVLLALVCAVLAQQVVEDNVLGEQNFENNPLEERDVQAIITKTATPSTGGNPSATSSPVASTPTRTPSPTGTKAASPSSSASRVAAASASASSTKAAVSQSSSATKPASASASASRAAASASSSPSRAAASASSSASRVAASPSASASRAAASASSSPSRAAASASSSASRAAASASSSPSKAAASASSSPSRAAASPSATGSASASRSASSSASRAAASASSSASRAAASASSSASRAAASPSASASSSASRAAASASSSASRVAASASSSPSRAAASASSSPSRAAASPSASASRAAASASSSASASASRAAASASSSPSRAAASASPTVSRSAGSVPCQVDGPASDVIPASGTVSSSWVNPGLSSTINTATQWGSTYWNVSQAPVVSQFATNSISLRTQSTASDGWFFTKDGAVPNVIGGASYTFTASFWQNAANEYWNGTATVKGATLAAATSKFNITLMVVDNLDETNIWTWFGKADGGDCSGAGWNTCKVLAIKPLFLAPGPTTEATKVTLTSTFTLPATGTAQILLRIAYPGYATKTGGNYYYLGDITFVRADQARSFPANLITSSSVHVNNVKPPVLPTPTQTNCPHKRTGLSNWHDPTIWPGSVVPAPDGRDVTLPAGLSVLISSCSIPSGPNSRYGTITVPATSELIFNDANMSITVGNILVHGHLWIGSETCRLYSRINITLSSSATDLGGVAGKSGITSSSTGSLDIHGKLYQYTWTRLAATAPVGDDRIIVQDAVNWEVGQQIVLVTSAFKDHLTPQNEVLTITAIDGKKIQFTPRLQFLHYAGQEYQAEVALLSRRIVIQGDATSESTSKGGHILGNGPVARFSGVQAYRMGQLNTMARYPFHFHNMGESPLSFFQDCSVYHSFYRCYTVHGTNSTRVSRNVAYDNQGHCYYIEDGVEENNLYEYNLAAYPQPIGGTRDFNAGGSQTGIIINQAANLLIPADAAPSGFYISNSNNRFVGNVASGGFAAYSFINFPKPIGNHRTDGLVPQERPLQQFYGNTAHSAGYYWSSAGCIYVGGSQYYTGTAPNEILTYNTGRMSRNTKDLTGKPAWMTFNHTRVYMCNQGVNHWGDRVEITNYEVYDFTRSVTMFGEAWLDSAYVDTRSNNPNLLTWPDVQQFEYYDTSVKTILSRTTFADLTQDPRGTPTTPQYWNVTIRSMTHSDKFKPQGINAAKGITFSNIWTNGRFGNYINVTGASRYYNIIDWDGSLLDRPFGAVPTLIGSANSENYTTGSNLVIKEWWNVNSQCVLYPQYTFWVCPKQAKQEIVNLYFDIHLLTNNVTLWPSDWSEKPCCNNVGTVSHFGYTGANRRSTIVTINPGVTGISGDSGWYLKVDRGSPSQMFIRAKQVPLVYIGGVATKTYVIFAIKYPAAAQFTITTQHLWKTALNGPVTQVTTFADMYNDPLGKSYYVKTAPAGDKWLYLKIVDRHYENEPVGSNYFERAGVRLYNVNVFYWYNIAVTCTGCAGAQTINGVTYWPVVDEVPNFVSAELGA